MRTHYETAKTPWFQALCQRAGVAPSKRQAAEFSYRRGVAYATMAQEQERREKEMPHET